MQNREEPMVDQLGELEGIIQAMEGSQDAAVRARRTNPDEKLAQLVERLRALQRAGVIAMKHPLLDPDY